MNFTFFILNQIAQKTKSPIFEVFTALIMKEQSTGFLYYFFSRDQDCPEQLSGDGAIH